jgi:phosphopantetheinyl transferase
MTKLTAYPWPEQQNTALSILAERSFVVIQIYAEHKTYQASSPKQQREQARASIRRAIQELLSHHFAIPIDEINIERQAGHIPGADLCIANHTIHLSISHEQERSVAAIYIEKANNVILGIGIDILKTPATTTIPDWQDVATLYLGPHINAAIAKLPLAEQAHSFALHWAKLEARFKSRGQALCEWSDASEIDKGRYQVHELDLPEEWGGVGAVTIRSLDK